MLNQSDWLTLNSSWLYLKKPIARSFPPCPIMKNLLLYATAAFTIGTGASLSCSLPAHGSSYSTGL